MATALQPPRPWVQVRRVCVAMLAGLTVALISWRTFLMLGVNGWDWLKAADFGLFVLLMLPIALWFWTALIGFTVRLQGGDSLELTRTLEGLPLDRELPCTAVVMPTYNEDPARVFAGLKVTFESVERTGFLEQFDFFVLSDTTDPDIWVREELAFADLRKEAGHPERFFYRNRRENAEKKSGNIADFCATWGGHYRYMIVLDADSIMTGTSLVNLVRLMEHNPRVGIVQAPPLPVNRRSLFGRLQQFAAHAYSSMFITGLNFWQGGAGNYWGHNAIIRIRPFVEHCRLPKLPGSEPLGGSILSHDFVEAALMRRAGWRVYLASELRGSYEEMPSSLINFAARDRRWCQGNLQHARLLFTPGFHIVSRLHLCMGVMSYVASPLWMLLLTLTTIEGLKETLMAHRFFGPGRSLFPVWEVSVGQKAIGLFLAVLSLLVLPKFLNLFLHLRNRREREAFGGSFPLTLSVLGEIVFSALLSPILALLQTRFVVGILMGRNVKWESQDRGETGTTYREALRRHLAGTLLGLIWGALLFSTVPRLFWWLSPVLAGFILAIPLSVWSSRESAGQWTQRHRLFLIPEEVAPPQILRGFQLELAAARHHAWAETRDGLAWVLESPEVSAVHLSFLRPPSDPVDLLHRHYLEGLRLKAHVRGLHSLTRDEKRQLLLDAEILRAFQNPNGEEPARCTRPLPARSPRIEGSLP